MKPRWAIVHFFALPNCTTFRWNREFWAKTGHNLATGQRGKGLLVPRETLVAIRKKDVTEDMVVVNSTYQEEFKQGKKRNENQPF